MCVDFKLGPLPTELEARRLLHQEFLVRLRQIPLDYYTITLKRIPTGLLRKNTVADYRKLLVSLVSGDNLATFLRTCEVGWFSDELRAMGNAEWIERVLHKAKKEGARPYLKEALLSIVMADKWIKSARTVLEAEFATRMLDEDDKAAKEILIRRYGSHWSEKLQAIHAQAQIAKELADKESGQATEQRTINFVLAGSNGN